MLGVPGVSAIIVGVDACIAAVIAYYILGGAGSLTYQSADYMSVNINTPYRLQQVIILAVALIFLCLVTVYLFSRRKAKQNGHPLLFDGTIKRLLWSFFLPLVVGGILCISLLW